ncbi:hypothetical protein D9Q98_003082 [Chlorella vulgaris]|uniref:Uncharacterized protein n=1 Tax=Chlorella vulgaris TaxID=3077 RepID=A0A9D4TVX5_CHLVU|nr:hypothetical protein D9Q98_003082 [Chlorella vulgaris]
MATRGRHTRDDGQKEFTGRVRRWRKVWVASKEPKSKELKFQRWLQTDERPPELAGPRHSYIVPVKEAQGQPYPKHMIVTPPAPPPPPAPVVPVAAAAAAGVKSIKLHIPSSAGPAPSAAPAAVAGSSAAAPKIKFKVTLGPRPDAGAAAAAAAAAAASHGGGYGS